MKMVEKRDTVRIDKWLWAARFFKTRSIASQAVNGGKVHLNENRVKSSRIVNIGDKLTISKGDIEFEITIVALSLYRRPAVEARMLYEESQASIDKRTEQRELKKMVQAGHTAPAKRPGKRDRRKIREFTRKE